MKVEILVLDVKFGRKRIFLVRYFTLLRCNRKLYLKKYRNKKIAKIATANVLHRFETLGHKTSERIGCQVSRKHRSLSVAGDAIYLRYRPV